MQHATEVNANKICALDNNIHITTQRWDITCEQLASQSCHSNKNTLKTAVISANGMVQKQQYVHGLKYDVTIAPHSIIPIILLEFHNCKGHQGTIHTFEAIRRSYWQPK